MSSKASPAWMNPPSPANPRPVIRESGGDRSAVTGGTRVLSDRIVIRVTMEKGTASWTA
jgi:high-affinity K+ transport system ATPase subunit B